MRLSRLAVFAILLLLPGAVSAQPNAVPLTRGFVPDPVVRIGSTTGTRPLRRLAPSCTGFVSEQPSQVLRLESHFAFLRFFVLASQPVSLAVRAPDGQWSCVQQRRARDRAPTIEGAFAPGNHEVWIAGNEANRVVSYELHVTEFRSWTAGSGRADRPANASGRDLGLNEAAEEGSHRGRRLRRGFLPDPREDRGTTGGNIDVSRLGVGCRGFVDVTPSHVLTLRDDFDYFRIQLGEAAGAASLVMRGPDGVYRCSSPSDRNAFLDNEAWPEGDYQIWVGSYDPETERRYRICYTEVRPSGNAIACGGEPDSPPSETPP